MNYNAIKYTIYFEKNTILDYHLFILKQKMNLQNWGIFICIPKLYLFGNKVFHNAIDLNPNSHINGKITYLIDISKLRVPSIKFPYQA